MWLFSLGPGLIQNFFEAKSKLIEEFKLYNQNPDEHSTQGYMILKKQYKRLLQYKKKEFTRAS